MRFFSLSHATGAVGVLDLLERFADWFRADSEMVL